MYQRNASYIVNWNLVWYKRNKTNKPTKQWRAKHRKALRMREGCFRGRPLQLATFKRLCLKIASQARKLKQLKGQLKWRNFPHKKVCKQEVSWTDAFSGDLVVGPLNERVTKPRPTCRSPARTWSAFSPPSLSPAGCGHQSAAPCCALGRREGCGFDPGIGCNFGGSGRRWLPGNVNDRRSCKWCQKPTCFLQIFLNQRLRTQSGNAFPDAQVTGPERAPICRPC